MTTNLLVNPSFETGNFTGWTVSDLGTVSPPTVVGQLVVLSQKIFVDRP